MLIQEYHGIIEVELYEPGDIIIQTKCQYILAAAKDACTGIVEIIPAVAGSNLKGAPAVDGMIKIGKLAFGDGM
jgi:hypothetical protein